MWSSSQHVADQRFLFKQVTGLATRPDPAGGSAARRMFWMCAHTRLNGCCDWRRVRRFNQQLILNATRQKIRMVRLDAVFQYGNRSPEQTCGFAHLASFLKQQRQVI
jgi:hypothetical protein